MVTAIGLGSLITQASSIQDNLDPYRSSRTPEHLGTWTKRQPKRKWHRLAQPPPIGPVIYAKLVYGFCGSNVIGVSRLPTETPGKASWTAILAIFHENVPHLVSLPGSPVHVIESKVNVSVTSIKEKQDAFVIDIESALCPREHIPWKSLQMSPLTRHNSSTCVVISRTTLITILALCNSRTMFQCSDASGHRVSYASYCGHFYINWPIGAPAVVQFHPHDSHSRSTDV